MKGFDGAFRLQLFSKNIKEASDAYITDRVSGEDIAIPPYGVSH